MPEAGLNRDIIIGKRMNRFSCFFNVVIMIALGGCGGDCSSIRDAANKEAVRSYLKGWVDSRISSGDYVLSESEDLGKVRLPGEYAVNIPLDYGLLGMSEPEARPVLDKHGKAVSFFFGETTYRGIMVKGEGSVDYGFPIGRLVEVDDRTAVLCIDH